MHGRVVRSGRLTPTLNRVVLGGGDLDGFSMVDATDAYVNLAFAPPGAPYGEVFDPKQVRTNFPEPWWPARRRYTVRAWDPESQELTIDFVAHGDLGVAGAWSGRAQPGDVLVLDGPSGGYLPDPKADWLLMAGDESALPAIAASLAMVPEDRPVVVRLICDGSEHEVDLTSPGELDLVWVHRRGGDRDSGLLTEALQSLSFPAGRAHAFVHGEATEIREARRHLMTDRGLPRADMSCSPYWRRDMTDEAWRRVKRDFVQAMEADVTEDRSTTAPW